MTKVIFIGISGATCSGKTTLAKHLRSLLPDSVIIHQDDFAPPQELVPIHPLHNVQDWDAANGAISWDRLVHFLKMVKKTGEIPPDHRSHDHLNENKAIEVDDGVKEKWMKEFERLKKENQGEQIVWAIVDGFLLYWHKEVIDQLDVRVMLRVPHDVLLKRRHERHGYHTAGREFLAFGYLIFSLTLRPDANQFLLFSYHPSSNRGVLSFPAHSCQHYDNRSMHFLYRVQSDPEGTLWRDPPSYWENIIWPAYVDAHKQIFENGDVEHGKLAGVIDGLVLLDTLEISMTDAVGQCCRVIHRVAQEAYGTKSSLMG